MLGSAAPWDPVAGQTVQPLRSQDAWLLRIAMRCSQRGPAACRLGRRDSLYDTRPFRRPTATACARSRARTALERAASASECCGRRGWGPDTRCSCHPWAGTMLCGQTGSRGGSAPGSFGGSGCLHGEPNPHRLSFSRTAFCPCPFPTPFPPGLCCPPRNVPCRPGISRLRSRRRRGARPAAHRRCRR